MQYRYLLLLCFFITVHSWMLSSLRPVGASLQRRVPALLRKPFQFTLAMNLNCGIVGLPNVGKSTLFNALVGSEAAQAANFPFCTIGNVIIDSIWFDYSDDATPFLQNQMLGW